MQAWPILEGNEWDYPRGASVNDVLIVVAPQNFPSHILQEIAKPSHKIPPKGCAVQLSPIQSKLGFVF